MMTGGQIALLVGLILLIDLMVVGAICYAVSQTMRDISSKFPPSDPRPDAVRRRFQSFKFGLVNLGWCVHVAVDDRHLHLSPTRLARWLGMRAMSVPWEAIEVVGKATIGSSIRVRIAGEEILGPAWCLNLAAQG
jgi:hypothetical protein